MEIKIYNSLDKKKEIFKPIEKDVLKMYSCGPTVYNYVHIGNLRAYFFMDLICRIFKYNGYEILNVLNITDVGHLVSDADEGEDKMLKAARIEKKSPFEIARFYEKAFLKDIKAMNILMPWKIVRATDHIKEMEEYVEDLIKKGFAYETSNTVYFDVSKVNNGKPILNKQKSGKIAGARVDVDKEKKNPEDFALWIKAPENHIMKWNSFFGEAYPGWHLECSVMANKYLGEVFDIHTGGTDHIPVHHENEIKQSIGKTGKVPANYFMHVEFLQVDGGKMSKSLGNTYTLSDLEERGFTPLDFRYFLMQTSYRKLINFTFESLKASQIALNKLNIEYGNLVKEIEEKQKQQQKDINVKTKEEQNKEKTKELEIKEKTLSDFKNAVNDDINITKGLSILWQLLKEDINPKIKKEIIDEMDEVFGFDLKNTYINAKELVEDEEIPEEIEKLLKEREEARKNKDFKLADNIRDKISAMGFDIIDTKDGQKLNKRM